MITSLKSFQTNRHGSLLIEVSVALGLTSLLALVLMRASLLAISGNQWTIMQTLTDAYLTRETAMANRIAFADLQAVDSAWPDQAVSPGISEQTITLGRLPGGREVTAVLKRCRTLETPQDADLSLTMWRLYSVLTYTVGEEVYTKSRSILRMQ